MSPPRESHPPPGRDLGTARFETFLRRLFSVKGMVAPAIEPKLQAGVELLNEPWVQLDTALLMGWRGFEFITPTVGAVAGQYGFLEVRNPPLSGGLVVVESVQSLALAGAYRWSAYTTGILGGGTLGNPVSPIDTRGLATTPMSSTVPLLATPAYGTNPVVPLNLGQRAYQPATGALYTSLRGPWIIAPGNCLLCYAGDPNTAVQFGCRYWERAAEPSELVAR